MARSTGASRGWATLDKRFCAACRATNRGCTLPVSSACCCAKPKADSISTTRFSSRERDRLCIRSSSWVRCNATSLKRASSKATLAAVSWVRSWAFLAMLLACMDSWPASALCLASISCMLLNFCQSCPPTKSASKAKATLIWGRNLRQLLALRTCSVTPWGEAFSGGVALLIQRILMTQARPTSWACKPAPGPRPIGRRLLRCAHGLPRLWWRTNLGPATAAPNG